MPPMRYLRGHKNKKESEIESVVRNHALRLGLLVYKFVSPGRRGVPDRMFVNKNVVIAFLEIKALGKKPTKVQSREINLLKVRGVLAAWSDDVEFCKEFLTDFSEL